MCIFTRAISYLILLQSGHARNPEGACTRLSPDNFPEAQTLVIKGISRKPRCSHL